MPRCVTIFLLFTTFLTFQSYAHWLTSTYAESALYACLGFYSIGWDGKDGAGGDVATGVYLYRLSLRNYSLAKKMLLVHREKVQT
ncbi:MAG: hypothetical protein HYR76_10565 [Ignavibacteria bacterium]|nr:hypothetical protein [Ignavibacteria bacterium]